MFRVFIFVVIEASDYGSVPFSFSAMAVLSPIHRVILNQDIGLPLLVPASRSGDILAPLKLLP